MRGFLVSLVFVFALGRTTVAEARIGDSEAQLVVRFGAVSARMPERILAEGRVCIVGERLVLKQHEWRVTAVLIDGRCAKITYAKTGAWAESQFTELLGVNAGRWAWSEVAGAVPKWQRTWRRGDGLVAKWKYASGFAIEAQSFVDARERAEDMARRAPVTAATR